MHLLPMDFCNTIGAMIARLSPRNREEEEMRKQTGLFEISYQFSIRSRYPISRVGPN